MDAVQVLASVTQLVSVMATTDLAEVPRRLQVLEDFVSNLNTLAQQARQRHAHKMHSPQLERQFQSLGRLMDQHRTNIVKARQVLSKKGRGKAGRGSPGWREAPCVNRQEHAVVGAGQVRAWLSVSKKCSYVRELLERDGGHRVLLIVGLSGIGRSCLARKIACDPPGNFVDWQLRSVSGGGTAEQHVMGAEVNTISVWDEAIYEIAEAEKVEISKDVIKEISKEILLYHSLLGVGELLIMGIFRIGILKMRTDDDLPPSYQNSRDMKGSGRITGNGRDTIGAGPYTRVQQPQTDMETQIHHLEQEAYCSVLRAFKAQSDAITWEKESLITELRKDLRVSDKEHRELLSRVDSDDIIRRIREWRESTGGLQMNSVNNAQRLHDPMPSPTTSAHKRQKTSQPILSASVPAQFAMHSQPLAAPMQPSSSGAKKAAPTGSKVKKNKPGQKIPGGPAVKSMPSSAGPSGRGPVINRNTSAGLPPEGPQLNPLIGRKVMTRWPDDNSFYEAVITDYDAAKDFYALVYDMNTAHETWEWVDLKEMAPEDVKWEGEEPDLNLLGRGAPVHGVKKSTSRGGPMLGAGRETLIKEVERVFNAGNADPLEMERAKKALKAGLPEQPAGLLTPLARKAR
ncbi:hypothetical protein C2845_PM13G09700 [Panicum miliaceum]|uniref:ENT domain-containing protein n=1 Tax=Panicum miliaceum TaxID=4540 RepID=A0A3L6RMM9_PANMI|nr:hypothetical protein C2845_PM13G09700 [Panicum miliaceum]